MFLEILQNSQKNTCAKAYFLIKLQASIKKKTLAQVFSWEFYKISKNTFFTEYIRMTVPYTSRFQNKIFKAKQNYLSSQISQPHLPHISATFFLIFNTLKVNKSVHIASRTYRFCWQYAIILVWKTYRVC